MAITEITCPICNTINPLSTVRQENQGGLSASIASYLHTRSTEHPSYEITCQLCKAKYQYLRMDGYGWIRNRLFLSGYSIETIKILADEYSTPIQRNNIGVIDWIFNHVVGITRTEKKKLNIFFDLSNHRICLSCYEEKKSLNGLSVYKVY